MRFICFAVAWWLVGCGIPPVGKPYDERKAAQFSLGMATTADVVRSMGKPWRATPLTAFESPAECSGKTERWNYSYNDFVGASCETQLTFDGNSKLCASTSSTALPGPACAGVER